MFVCFLSFHFSLNVALFVSVTFSSRLEQLTGHGYYNYSYDDDDVDVDDGGCCCCCRCCNVVEEVRGLDLFVVDFALSD